MGEGTRGRKPSVEKRVAILQAAYALFAERGVEAATTRDIAAQAQTTERTLFKHFGSKQGLIQSVIDEMAIQVTRDAAYGRIWERRALGWKEFASWYRMFMEDRVEAAIQAPEAYRVLFRELFRDENFRRVFVARWTEGVLEPMAWHMEQMQSSGEITREQSPRCLAAGLFSLTIGYLVSRFVIMPDGPWNGERDMKALEGLVHNLCRSASAEA
jgi:AcrR family transcriptional regulator